MKRYFIVSLYRRDSQGGRSSYGHFVTNGEFPSKDNILKMFGESINVLSSIGITEVKSITDIDSFLGVRSWDVVNYPPRTRPFQGNLM